jgi:regulatory protein
VITNAWGRSTKHDYSELSFDEQLYEARKKTERLLAVRDRSEREMRDRLTQAGFSEQVVEREVGLLVAAGLIDDERFTRLYIAGKSRSGWGRLRIEKELGRFGIDLKHCEGYPEEFFCEEDEFERALHDLERFSSRAKDRYSAQYRFLAAKGFSAGTIRGVLAAQKYQLS